MSFSVPTSPISDSKLSLAQRSLASTTPIPSIHELTDTLLNFVNTCLPHLNRIELSSPITSLNQLSDGYIIGLLLHHFITATSYTPTFSTASNFNDANSDVLSPLSPVIKCDLTQLKPVRHNENLVEPEEKAEGCRNNWKFCLSLAKRFLELVAQTTPDFGPLQRLVVSSGTESNGNGAEKLVLGMCELVVLVSIHSEVKESVIEQIMAMSDVEQSILMQCINDLSHQLNLTSALQGDANTSTYIHTTTTGAPGLNSGTDSIPNTPTATTSSFFNFTRYQHARARSLRAKSSSTNTSPQFRPQSLLTGRTGTGSSHSRSSSIASPLPNMFSPSDSSTATTYTCSSTSSSSASTKPASNSHARSISISSSDQYSQDQIHTLQSEVHQLTLDLRISRETQSNLVKQIQHQQSAHQQQLDQCAAEIRAAVEIEFSAKIKNLQHALSAEKSQHERELKSLRYELNEKTEVIQNHALEQAQWSKQKNLLKDEISQLRDEVQIQSQKAADKQLLEQRLSRMQSRLDSAVEAKQQYDSLEETTAGYESRLRELEVELQQLEPLKSKISDLEADLHRQQLSSQTLKNNETRLKKENDELEFEVGQLKCEIRKITNDFNELQAELSAVKEVQLEEKKANFALKLSNSTPPHALQTQLEQLSAENLLLKSQLIPRMPLNSTQLELQKYMKLAQLWAKRCKSVEKELDKQNTLMKEFEAKMKGRELIQWDEKEQMRREKLLMGSAVHSLVAEWREHLIHQQAQKLKNTSNNPGQRSNVTSSMSVSSPGSASSSTTPASISSPQLISDLSSTYNKFYDVQQQQHVLSPTASSGSSPPTNQQSSQFRLDADPTGQYQS